MKKVPKVFLAFVVSLALLLFLAWFWMTQPILFPSERLSGIPSIDPAKLEGHVRKLSETFHPRDIGHPENLERAAAYIAEELQKAGGEVSDQVFRVEEKSYRNIVATFGPATRERVVVGAHYDTHGELPGADDNASGVAGLLELSALLGRESLPRRVELVAYALEELPVFGSREMGSSVHARALRDSGVSVRVMFSLEMIGCFSDEPNSQKLPFAFFRLFYPSRGNFIAVVGRIREAALVRRVKASMRSATDLPVYSINSPPIIPGIDLSDHVSFWDLGYPAVMVTDTAFYRNDRYHTDADTAETLDYLRMAKVVEGIFQAVRDLSAL